MWRARRRPPRILLLAALVATATARAWAAPAPPPFYADKTDLLVYIDADGKQRPITRAADWAKRREHILANMQLVMGPLPDASRKAPLDVRTEEEVRLAKVTRRKITFAVERGDRAWAYLLIPNGLEGRAAGMLCLHPTSAAGKAVPAGLTKRANRAYALELAKRGYVALAPDYPNSGDYRVDLYRRGYASATMKGIWNHMRAIDLLQALPQVDPGRIGCIGHSLGGHNTLFLAVFDPRIKAMVSSCGFNAFPKYMGGNLAGWSHRGYMPRIASVYGNDPKKMPFDFTEVVAALAPRPVFVNAPLRDGNFEVSGVKDCVRAALPVYELLGARGSLVAVHPRAGHDFPPAVREAAYKFLDDALARAPQ
jgi:dienelactone hydrolase